MLRVGFLTLHCVCVLLHLAQQCADKLDVDLISLDLSQRLPFHIKPPQIRQALARGVHFEICYSAAIGGAFRWSSRPHCVASTTGCLCFTAFQQGKTVWSSVPWPFSGDCHSLTRTTHSGAYADGRARTQLIANAQNLVRVSKGRGLVFSSEVSTLYVRRRWKEGLEGGRHLTSASAAHIFLEPHTLRSHTCWRLTRRAHADITGGTSNEHPRRV